MMAAIAVHDRARSRPYERWNETRVRRDARDPAYTSPTAPCEAARELELDALVIPTLSGRSARLVSAHRPTVPIYALSPGKETVRRCGLMWGVQAASMRRHEVTEELIADAARRVVELGWCKPGERVGITAGLPSGRPGTTSLFQVQQLQTRRRAARAASPAQRRAHVAPGERQPDHAPSTTSTAIAAIASGEPQVVERAAQRGVGERARRAADRGRQRRTRRSGTGDRPAA